MHKIMGLCLLLLLVSCKDARPTYSGYIDADMTYLASNYSGRLIALGVVRGQLVQKNQILFKLQQTNEYYQVAMSQENQDNLKAQRQAIVDQIHYNVINYTRTLHIRKQNAASQNDLEVAKKDLDVLKSQLAAIDAQIKSNQLNRDALAWQARQKQAYAVDAGLIFDTYFTKGEYVQAGQPVVSLITPAHIKVIFYVPETDLSRIALQDKIKVSMDHSTQLITGRISYIANTAQYTPPILFSRENRQTLVFRVEATLDAPNLKQIHLGQPVSLEFVG